MAYVKTTRRCIKNRLYYTYTRYELYQQVNQCWNTYICIIAPGRNGSNEHKDGYTALDRLIVDFRFYHRYYLQSTYYIAIYYYYYKCRTTITTTTTTTNNKNYIITKKILLQLLQQIKIILQKRQKIPRRLQQLLLPIQLLLMKK